MARIKVFDTATQTWVYADKSFGKDGTDGKDGVSPTVAVNKSGKVTTISITDKNGTKNATINDGTDGSPGSNGKDGTSVTVKSVSESTADGGSNVVTFSDGTTLTVKNGSKGNKGDPGTTPQKGIDFWTPADQESIVQDVIAALGTPVFGRVDTNNNIILTGELADGTYVLKYEDADGKLTEIGSVDIGGPAYTNQLPISTDTNDSIFNGTGYKVGYRLNSSSAVVAVGTAGASNPVFVTGFIPVTTGQTVYLKNCYIDTDGINGSPSSTETKNYYGEACSSLNILLCGTNKVTMNSVSWVNAKASEYFTLTPDSNGIVTEFKCNRSALGYIRMVLAGDPANAIITVDQPITD